MGYVAESNMTEFSKRFLDSLYGEELIYGCNNHFVFKSVYECTYTYKVLQERYHLAFKAGTQQFKAYVFGTSFVAFTNVTKNK